MTTDKRKHIIKIAALLAILLSICNALLITYRWQYEETKVIELIFLFFFSFIWIFIGGFAIGALTSFIPFKKLTYKQKYIFNAFTCTIVIAIPSMLNSINMIYYTKYVYNF